MRRPPRRRLQTVRLLAAASAVLMVLTWGWMGTSADAQATSGTRPTLRLLRQTDWVGPEAVFQVVVSASGLPPGATVGGVLHERVRDRSTLAAAAGGEAPGSTIFMVRDRPVAEVTGTDGGIVMSLAVSSASTTPPDVASLVAAGVYPFTVVVRDDAGAPVAELVTTMLRLGQPAATASARLAVGAVVPVETAVRPGEDGAPTLAEDAAADLTATIGAITDQSGLPLTVSPSAESLELLQANGAAWRAAVTGLRSRVDRQILAGPYAPVDTGAWIDDGLTGELDGQYAAGTVTLQALLGSRPSAGVAVLDRTVSPAALARLRGLGVEAVAVPSGQLTPRSNDTFAEQFDLASGFGVTTRAVVADDPTALRLVDAADPVLAGHRALAELAYLHLAQSQFGTTRGVAVAVPATTSPATLRTFLAGLAGADGAASGSVGEPMLTPVTLEGLFAATAPAVGSRSTVRGYEADPPADLGRYPADLRAGRAYLDGLRSLAPTAPDITTPIDRTLLSSGARTLDVAQRAEMVGSAERSIGAVTGEIVVTPEQVVTLTSSSGKVPLNLENRLRYPVSVRLELASAKLDFPEGSVIEETLPAAQTTTINLQVETRASGAFPLTVEISSADGALPVATTRYTVRSTAISGVGLVLSIGAGLFLLLWWGRHFRTSRRARKLVAANHPAVSTTEPDGYAPPDPELPQPDPDPLEGR